MAGRKTRRNFDEDAALSAAMQVFWAKGYEATGVDELCKAMGIGRQSMYDWIGDKFKLYVATQRHYHDFVLRGKGGQMLEQDGSPLEALENMMQFWLDYSKSEECIGCHLTNGLLEMGGKDEELDDVLQSSESYIAELISTLLERAREAGEISRDKNIQSLVKILLVIRNGIMVAGRGGRRDDAVFDTIEFVRQSLRT